MIYLDNAATTPPDPQVVEAMMPYFTESWHNPSSGYRASKTITQALETARAQVAALIDAEPYEIFFTSGGTESNNTILHSLDQLLPADATFSTSQIEHSSILNPCERLKKSGRTINSIGVNEHGVIDLSALENGSPSAVSIMWANNEVGTIQPMDELSSWTREYKVALHTDAVQIIGKLPISVKKNPVDFLSLSGHKFHGPKGVGALYIREGMRKTPLLLGGGQEREFRSGTENVPAIIGMGKAAELAQERLSSDAIIRNTFEQEILKNVEGAEINGNLNNRLPNLSHLSFRDCEAEGLVILLDELGVQCATGSACMTGKQQPSHVQKAMGFSDKKAKSSVRFSFNHFHTQEDGSKSAHAVVQAVEKLRSVQAKGIGPVQVYTP